MSSAAEHSCHSKHSYFDLQMGSLVGRLMFQQMRIRKHFDQFNISQSEILIRSILMSLTIEEQRTQISLTQSEINRFL